MRRSSWHTSRLVLPEGPQIVVLPVRASPVERPNPRGLVSLRAVVPRFRRCPPAAAGPRASLQRALARVDGVRVESATRPCGGMSRTAYRSCSAGVFLLRAPAGHEQPFRGRR